METINLFLNQACVWILLALVLYAAWSDFAEYIIPNSIPVGLLTLYPAFVLSSPQPVDWQIAGLIAGGVFVFGAILFRCGLMGGGDVKLMSVCALWAGSAYAIPFIFLTTFVGGAIALALMLRLKYGWIVGFPERSLADAKVPYGIAIAAGGAFVATGLLAAA